MFVRNKMFVKLDTQVEIVYTIYVLFVQSILCYSSEQGLQ